MKKVLALGGAVALLAALVLWLRPGDTPVEGGSASATADGSSASPGKSPARSAATGGALSSNPQALAEEVREVPCQFSSLLEEFRRSGHSKAYRRYLKGQLLAMAGSIPAEQLWALLQAEEEPEVLETLAAVWVTRYEKSQDTQVLKRLVQRTLGEPDPARRAALVRAFQATVEPASEILGKMERGLDTYKELIRDRAPEVRQAVVDNMKDEAKRSFWRSQATVDNSIALATEASDPKVAADILGAASIEYGSKQTVKSVKEVLRNSGSREVRAAAASALGSVSHAEAPGTLETLTRQYEAERAPEVQKAILEAIVRIGMTHAIPTLQKLRDVHPSQREEVDLWLAALSRTPQHWPLLLRDKQILEASARR